MKAIALLVVGCSAPSLFLGFSQTAASAQPEPQVEQVIVRLQAELEALESALPDFMCEEKVTSQEWRGEKLRHQTVNESHFSARRNSRNGETISFAEVRTIYTVDSKRVPPGRKLKGPFIFRNVFVNQLHAFISPIWAPRYDFRLEGRETAGGQNALVVAFTARSDQQITGITLGNRFYPSRVTGKIWVEANSGRILRLSWSYPDLPKPVAIAVSVEYFPVDIGGRPFQMPRVVRTECPDKNPKEPADRKNRVYTAEYSDYRKFEVNSTITFEK